MIFTYLKVRNIVFPLYDSDKPTLVEKIAVNKFARNVIISAKNGGLIPVLQNTIERIYIINSKGNDNSSISTLRIDPSHSGEFLYLFRRIQSKLKFPYEKLFVDVGANDGFLSSNSFGFIQHGWNAVLVEPLSEQLGLAKQHISRYVDEYNEKKQNVRYVEAVLGSKDGVVQLVITSDLASMESHVLNDRTSEQEKKNRRKVKQISVQTFINEYRIPGNFGILSIDAEGQGNQILHQFIDLNSRPAYIIYENLHEKGERRSDTIQYLRKAGYKYLTTRGWNVLLEYTER